MDGRCLAGQTAWCRWGVRAAACRGYCTARLVRDCVAFRAACAPCALAPVVVGAPAPPCCPLWCLGGCCISACSRPWASVSHGWGGHVCLAGCGVVWGGGGSQRRHVRCPRRCGLALAMPPAALCLGRPVCACLRSSLAPTGRVWCCHGDSSRMCCCGGGACLGGWACMPARGRWGAAAACGHCAVPCAAAAGGWGPPAGCGRMCCVCRCSPPRPHPWRRAQLCAAAAVASGGVGGRVLVSLRPPAPVAAHPAGAAARVAATAAACPPAAAARGAAGAAAAGLALRLQRAPLLPCSGAQLGVWWRPPAGAAVPGMQRRWQPRHWPW